MTNKNTIKSVGEKDEEIINNILKLHAEGKPIDVDVTYSKGQFYANKVVKKPKLRFDIAPQSKEVTKADCRKLPLKDESVGVLMFDPPFISRGGSKSVKPTGMMRTRFGNVGKHTEDLWKFYEQSLTEFFRVLKPNGIVIFKCQDVVTEQKNFFSHVQIMQIANKVGFYPKDLLIKVVKSRAIDPRIVTQQHARKFHTFFWVFQKSKQKVSY